MASPSSVVTSGDLFTTSLIITDGFGSQTPAPVTADDDSNRLRVGVVLGVSLPITNVSVGG